MSHTHLKVSRADEIARRKAEVKGDRVDGKVTLEIRNGFWPIKKVEFCPKGFSPENKGIVEMLVSSGPICVNYRSYRMERIETAMHHTGHRMPLSFKNAFYLDLGADGQYELKWK